MPGPARLCQREQSSSSTSNDGSRGFVSGGDIAAAGVGIPCPSTGVLIRVDAPGALKRSNDRDYFSHSMAVAMVLHDMPQHDNRLDLDPNVKDVVAPVRPHHLQTHQNDIDQGRFLVDRCGEILDSAEAKQVDRVYAEKVTATVAPAWHRPYG